MSKHSEQFSIPMPAPAAEVAVKEAVASCGWGVKEHGPGRLVPRIGIGITRMPSTIEVLMMGDGDSTQVTLNGKIAGLGPLQKRHITAEVGKLRNAIDVAVHRTRSGPAG